MHKEKNGMKGEAGGNVEKDEIIYIKKKKERVNTESYFKSYKIKSPIFP